MPCSTRCSRHNIGVVYFPQKHKSFILPNRLSIPTWTLMNVYTNVRFYLSIFSPRTNLFGETTALVCPQQLNIDLMTKVCDCTEIKQATPVKCKEHLRQTVL